MYLMDRFARIKSRLEVYESGGGGGGGGGGVGFRIAFDWPPIRFGPLIGYCIPLSPH